MLNPASWRLLNMAQHMSVTLPMTHSPQWHIIPLRYQWIITMLGKWVLVILTSFLLDVHYGPIHISCFKTWRPRRSKQVLSECCNWLSQPHNGRGKWSAEAWMEELQLQQSSSSPLRSSHWARPGPFHAGAALRHVGAGHESPVPLGDGVSTTGAGRHGEPMGAGDHGDDDHLEGYSEVEETWRLGWNW